MTDDAPKWNGLRRTRMKPGKGLKRSGRLRQRSKTNSRPHECMETRNAYRTQFERCQCCRWIFGHASKWVHDAEHIHHLLPGLRRDSWPNLVAVCARCHDWIHKHPVDGRWVSLYAKMKLGGEHWNLEELNRGARGNVEGWVLRTDKQPRLAWVEQWYKPSVLAAIGGEK